MELSLDDLRSLEIPVPHVNQQRATTAFLDHETAQIDELMAEKEKMLGILEEKRSALISRAVTEGIDPKAIMKSSGVNWLGKIPHGWETHRAKRLLAVRDDRSEDGSEELLTVSHLTGVTPRAEKDVYMFKADTLEGYKKCGPGDLAINTLWAWMGAMGTAKVEGIVSPDYHVYRIGPRFDPAFIEYLCRSRPFVAEVNRHSKGVWSSRLRLYPEAFFNIALPVPSLDEQRAIVSHLDSQLQGSAELAAALRDSIRLLGERRTALITAAVTGQVPVPEMN